MTLIIAFDIEMTLQPKIDLRKGFITPINMEKMVLNKILVLA
jgi:hypothetical protein